MKLRYFRVALPSAALIREFLEYDPETGIFLWRHRKSLRGLSGKKAGTKNAYGYIVIKISGQDYYASRLAFVYVHGDVLGCDDDVDHENRIRDDNRICNLRKASRTQNAANNIRSRSKHDLPRGVVRDGKKFRASIRAFGVRKHLGNFNTADEAGRAYQSAARQEFGEFARAP